MGVFSSNLPYSYMATSAIQTLAGSFSQAESIATQGAYQAAQERTNAHLADMSAKDALYAGDWEAAQVTKRGEELSGRQLASSGSQGVSAGSMAPQVAATQKAAAADAIMARYNAYNRAFGFKMEKMQDESKAKMTDLATDTAFKNTIATGGLQAIKGGVGDYMEFTRASGRGF